MIEYPRISSIDYSYNNYSIIITTTKMQDDYHPGIMDQDLLEFLGYSNT